MQLRAWADFRERSFLLAAGSARFSWRCCCLFIFLAVCLRCILWKCSWWSVCIDCTTGELDQGFVFIWEKRKNPGHQKCLLYQEMNSLLEGSSGYKTKIKTRALYKPTLYCLLHKQPHTWQSSEWEREVVLLGHVNGELIAVVFWFFLHMFVSLKWNLVFFLLFQGELSLHWEITLGKMTSSCHHYTT